MSRRVSFRFQMDQHGSVALIFGLVVPVLIGFTGLAVDGAFWLKERNKLQATTDNSVISAARSLQLDGATNALSTEAKKSFTSAYGSKSSQVKVSINYPPASGTLKGNASAVEVVAEKQQGSFFLAALGMTSLKLATRSVAQVQNTGESCILALSTDADRAIEITGNTTVSLGCGILANSNSPEAIYLSGNATVSTTNVAAVGDIVQKNNAKLNVNGGTAAGGAQALKDPYGPEGRNLKAPTTPTACKENSLQVKGNKTLSPGRYCGGIDFKSGTATLSPGVYIIDGGDFTANAQATVKGDNVTIILTGATTNNTGRLHINGGASLALHAPASGTPYDGVLFFQNDPETATATHSCHAATSSTTTNVANTNYINGNADLDLKGAVYFPHQEMRFSGGTNAKISCLQIVSETIRIDGNANVSNACSSSSGTSRISQNGIDIVE